MLFQDAMAQALTDHDVHTIFGLIGDGNLFIVDSFRRLPGTTYVDLANEASAVEAALGYAHTAQRLGVATVTHGPALTNTVTPLVEAVKAHMPLLLIAGDTPAADRDHVQKVAQRDVVLASGAGFEAVRTPLTLAEDLATAIRRAQVEKRPIVLDVPAEFQWQETEYVSVPARYIPPQDGQPAADALDRAVGIIASAHRPVVLAGRGAIAPKARAAIVRFANRIGAPVATTLKGHDLFRGQPHDLGIFGTLSHEVALNTISASDCVIVFGAGLNKFTTAEGSLTSKRSVVQVDEDRAAIGRFVVPDAAVVADAATAADAFVELLDQAEIAATRFASPELAAELAHRTDADYLDRSTEETVDIRTALLRVEQAVPADRTIVFDSGRFVRTGWTLLHVDEPASFVHTANYGAIGLGMGTAIGAAVGRPGHPVLLVSGDGGFMLGGLAEFSAAVRHRVDLVVLLLNDGAFGAEHIQFVNRGQDPGLSMFDWPDFGPVATALGGRGYTVRNVAELDTALAELPARDRPVLIDVHIDPAQVPFGDH